MLTDYMYQEKREEEDLPAPVQENNTHKVLWDFDIHTDHQISARRPDLIIKVKLATIVEGEPKALFSIATTLRCRGGRYSFPWIAPLYPWYVPYIAEC